MIHLIQQSCLEKITPETTLKKSYDHASALVGEELAYQIVLYNDSGKVEPFHIENLTGMYNHLFLVKYVPVSYPHCSARHNGEYVLDKPGVLPDCLVPITEDDVLMIGPHYTVLWICLKTSMIGSFRLQFRFYSDSCEAVSDFTFEVIDHDLSESMVSVYEHIYPTSVANEYHLPLFSSPHWELLSQYFDLAAEHGVTHLLTPLYPVIYRSTVCESVQLVKIKKTKNGFEFNYDLFDCWVLNAQKKGIKNFVLPPLFPDLFVLKALPFSVDVEGKTVTLFGEKTSCFSAEYHAFICMLLRSFNKHLRQRNLLTCVSIQLADGVSFENLENYTHCRDMVVEAIRPLRLIEPVLETELYEKKDFAVPVLSMDRVQTLLSEKNPMYLTCTFDPSAHASLADLLIASDAARLRYLGLISYRYNLLSYFNRGFNYNGSLNSDSFTEQALNLEAENRFPSGAMTLTYPGKNGPLPSVRLKLLLYALQDVRAIEALEGYKPYKNIISLIDRECPLRTDGPNLNAEKLLRFRETVNQLLLQYSKK